MVKLSHEQWLAEAERRYGQSLRKIRFRCPACGYVQSGQDFLDLGMKPEEAAQRAGFSCIGRWSKAICRSAFEDGEGPCNYAGGGLICISPISVRVGDQDVYVFNFADEPLVESAGRSESPEEAAGGV